MEQVPADRVTRSIVRLQVEINTTTEGFFLWLMLEKTPVVHSSLSVIAVIILRIWMEFTLALEK